MPDANETRPKSFAPGPRANKTIHNHSRPMIWSTNHKITVNVKYYENRPIKIAIISLGTLENMTYDCFTLTKI